MSNEENIINLLLLRGYLGNFESEKRNFDNLTYSNFNSSYIKTCSDKYVSQMNGKLTDLYNQIKTGYQSIYEWWALYNNNVETLESILSSDGRNSSSLESNIQVIVNILPLLEDYDISLSGFTEPFSIGEGINIENIQLSGILVPYVIDEKTTIMLDKNLIPLLEQQLKGYNELILSLDETSIQLKTEKEKYQIAMGTFMGSDLWNSDRPDIYKMQYNPTDEELRKYTEEYNKKFSEIMNELGTPEITSFEQFEEKIKFLSTEISSISNSQYYIRQTIKALPYSYLKQNEDFNNYGNYSDYKNIEYTESWITRTRTYDFKINGQTLSSVNYLALAQLALEDEEFKKKFVVNNRYSYNQSGQIIDSKLKEAMESLNYISVDELKLYNYLFDKQGQATANAYLKSIEDNINQRKGIVEASEFLYYLNDGGKFSQFIETAFEGTADGVETFFEGLENVVNASGVKSDTQYKQMIILQALSDQLNNEDFIKMCKESGCYEEILKVVNQNTLNLDGKPTFNQITEEYGDYGKVLSLTYNVGNTFGNMLPAMVTAMMTSALATPMVGAKVGEVLASVGSSTFMGVSAGGNAANQMLIEGRTSQQAIAFGILTGLSESTLQYFLGNIPGINQKAKLALKEILEEGLEEGIQSVLGRVFKSWSTSEPIDLDGLSQEVATSFVMGCLISGMTTGGQTLIKYGGAVFSLNSEQLTNIMNSENPMESLSEYINNKINPPIQNTSNTNENSMGYIRAEKAMADINNTFDDITKLNPRITSFTSNTTENPMRHIHGEITSENIEIVDFSSKTNNQNLNKIQMPNEFQVTSGKGFNATCDIVPIGVLMDIIMNDEMYAKFLNFSNNKKSFNHPQIMLANGIYQLINVAAENNYNLGFTQEHLNRINNIVNNYSYTIDSYIDDLKIYFFNNYSNMINYGGPVRTPLYGKNYTELMDLMDIINQEEYQQFFSNKLNEYAIKTKNNELLSIIFYMNEYRNEVLNSILSKEIKDNNLRIETLDEIFKIDEIPYSIILNLIRNDIDVGHIYFNTLVRNILGVDSPNDFRIRTEDGFGYLNRYNQKYGLQQDMRKVISLYNTYNGIVVNNLENYFGDIVENIREKLNNRVVFKTGEAFKKIGVNENCLAFNNGVVSVMSLDYYQIIFENMLHESLHQLSSNLLEDTYGLSITINKKEYYSGINEAITEYFSILSSYEKYTLDDSMQACGYAPAVSRLIELIELGVIDMDTLKQVYFTNDIERFKKTIEDSLPLIGFENLMNAFDKAIDNDNEIKKSGLNTLDKIIIMLRMDSR